MILKKYGNRRLYDTGQSRYVTLEDVASWVRSGGDELKVSDAKTGEDLTDATLAQILIEGRGAGRMLPGRLLKQLIRLGDDSLTEFLGNYVSWALEMYVAARQTTSGISPLNPFFAIARMFGGAPVPAPPPPPVARSEPELRRARPPKKRG